MVSVLMCLLELTRFHFVGKLRCVGSSLYLKSKFGIGYLLTLVKDTSAASRSTASSDAISKLIRSYVPEAQLLSDVASEVAFRLPYKSVASFPRLFDALDNGKQRLGIISYGVSITTLEEVFMRIAQEGEEEGDVAETNQSLGKSLLERRQKDATEYKILQETREEEFEEEEEITLDIQSQGQRVHNLLKRKELNPAIHAQARDPYFHVQLWALIIKRMRISIRDAKAFIFQVLLPVACVIGAVVLYRELQHSASQPPFLDLEDSMFKDQYIFPWTGDDQALHLLELMNGFNETDAELFPRLQSADVLRKYLLHEDVSDVPAAVSFSRIKSHNGTDNTTAEEFFLESPYFLDMQSSGPAVNYTLFWNPTYLHAMPIFVQKLNNAIMRNMTGSLNYTTRVSNAPFPSDELLRNIDAQLYFSYLILFGFSILPTSFASFVVRERQIKAKHLQVSTSSKYLSKLTLSCLISYLSLLF